MRKIFKHKYNYPLTKSSPLQLIRYVEINGMDYNKSYRYGKKFRNHQIIRYRKWGIRKYERWLEAVKLKVASVSEDIKDIKKELQDIANKLNGGCCNEKEI